MSYVWSAWVNEFPSQCGGRIIHDFRLRPQQNVGLVDNDGNKLHSLRAIKLDLRGKMLVATFNQHQFEAYKECCKTFKLIGQSTPIRNNSSGNYIFTAVFQA